MKEERILAWHFLPNDGCLRNGNGREGQYGKWRNPKVRACVVYVHKGPIEPCKRGLHASIKATDALRFASGTVVTRVECWDRVEHEGGNKLVCGHRKVLWVADATKPIQLWALWCAEEALKLVPKPDPRSIAAIDAGRKFLDGKITLDELNAAYAAAYAAANAAANAAYAAANAAYAAYAAVEYIDFCKLADKAVKTIMKKEK